ncbi:hypothetical protein E2C06_22360 [Dankookia rubra]|uniref:DUF1236 domain-containing protein n=1 Tax=Dankookia rubra TaxID=1442381 RepID=A0A4R5QCN9_9PROT|nr:hypothetical protein [Dankookia rubra]TDH60369.1 hypothetical protein E2C06_22360 [Dankookia rubra]
MTAGRRTLLGLAGLVLPAAAWAQPLPKPPAQPKPPAGKPAKPAGRAAPPQAKAAPATRSAKARDENPRVERRSTGQQGAEQQAGPEPAAGTGPAPRGPVPAREDAPTLRPLDRELVRQWLTANPDWRPAGHPLPVGEGRSLPPGLPRRPLPPELAVVLPYFPGYRYAAVGPDLVLYTSGTEVVASLLRGALNR